MTLSILFPLVLIVSCNLQKDQLRFVSLKIDHYENPLGIENPRPMFSWIAEADGFNRHQSAYQLLVASSADKLNPEEADLWNSGRFCPTSQYFCPMKESHLFQ
jgi:alpha-L-rhamnosidase